MRYFSLFAFFIFMCSGINLNAQTYTQNVRGRVSDKDTKISLPGANVILLNTEPLKGTVTDVNGYFRLEKVLVGRQSFRISFLGYEDVILREIEISSARETYINIELKPSFIQNEEVIITAKHAKHEAMNDMSVVSTRSFSVEETNKYAGSWGDPSRMAANFAGVSVVSDKRNDIIVRGNSPMGVLWMLDGVEIPNPNHFAVAGSSGGAISMINNNLLDNSDFHTGAFAAEYSNALSAVFDLKMRNGNNENREYIAQAGVNGFEAGAEGPFIKGKNASYIINYRYSTLSLLDELGISIIEAIPNFQDISFKFNFPLNKGFFSFWGIAGKSTADYKPEKSIDFLTPPQNRNGYISGTRMGITAFSFQHLLSSKTYFKTNVSVSAYNPFDGSDSTGLDYKVYEKYFSEFTEYKYSVNVLLNSKLNNRNIIRSGAAAQSSEIVNNNYTVHYNPSSEKHIISSFNGNLQRANVHIQWLHQLNENLLFTTGVNAMKLFLNNKKCLEPRLSIKWDFFKHNTLTAGFGIHNQTQAYAIYFLETIDSLEQISLPNKNLGFSQSMHFILAYQRQLSENLRLKVETYYQSLNNIPLSITNPYFSLLNFATDDNIMNYNQLISNGKGYNYGVETTFEKFLNKGYYYLLTATIFESKYYDGFNNLRNTRFNTNYLLSFLAGKDFKFRFQKNSTYGLHTKFCYIGGQRYIPIDLSTSNAYGYMVYYDSLAFNEQYPAFIKLDLRLRYRVNMKRFAGELAVDVTNIFNRKNVEYQTYDKYLKKVDYVYNLSRIPVIFLRFEF